MASSKGNVLGERMHDLCGVSFLQVPFLFDFLSWSLVVCKVQQREAETKVDKGKVAHCV